MEADQWHATLKSNDKRRTVTLDNGVLNVARSCCRIEQSIISWPSSRRFLYRIAIIVGHPNKQLSLPLHIRTSSVRWSTPLWKKYNWTILPDSTEARSHLVTEHTLPDVCVLWKANVSYQIYQLLMTSASVWLQTSFRTVLLRGFWARTFSISGGCAAEERASCQFAKVIRQRNSVFISSQIKGR